MQDLEVYLYVVIFVGTILLIEGLYLFLRDTRTESELKVNRRARLIASGATQSETLRKLKRVRLTEPTNKDEDRRFSAISPLKYFDQALDDSGTMISTPRFLFILALLVISIFTALYFFFEQPLFLALMIALLIGVGLPLLMLRRRKANRLRKLAEQLPDAIDMIVRSLRAGHPVRTAFAMVASEMEDPIGSEFGILVDELTYGLDIQDALVNLESRNDVEDLHFMVVAINLQNQTGGNLAEILSNLSTVIRDRFRMKRRVRALSAEGRLSAMVIACVPFFVVAVMAINSPSYYQEAFEHSTFPFLIGVAVLLYFGSMLVIYKIVNFRV